MSAQLFTAPGAGAVVGAVGGLVPQHVEDGLGHVAREGEAAQLVVHDGDLVQLVLGVGDAVGERLHGLHGSCAPSPMTQELRMM